MLKSRVSCRAMTRHWLETLPGSSSRSVAVLVTNDLEQQWCVRSFDATSSAVFSLYRLSGIMSGCMQILHVQWLHRTACRSLRAKVPCSEAVQH